MASLLTPVFLHDHCFPLLSTWLIRASSLRRSASAMRRAGKATGLKGKEERGLGAAE